MQNKKPEWGELYIGIDLNDRWTQISYYRHGMEEPETISIIVGEERYRIATTLYRKNIADQWHLKEAMTNVVEGSTETHVDYLLSGSLKDETILLQEEYKIRDLFLVYLRKLIWLVPGLGDIKRITGLAFNLEQVSMKKVTLLRKLMEEIGVASPKIFIVDKKESFCHFMMHQDPTLRQYHVLIFQCENEQVKAQIFHKDNKTNPIRIEIQEIDFGSLPREKSERDRVFDQMAQQALEKRITSAVYLTGDGFDGEWLRQSQNTICRGRRAFQGKNLYSKGACYGAQIASGSKQYEYIYFSEYTLKRNIFLKVRHGEQTQFFSLADAGCRRYECNGHCELLLDQEPYVDIWIQAPEHDTARIESLELTDLPSRPPRTTRLQVEICPAGETKIMIRITDLGFGPWFLATGKVWEYYIDE